MEPNLLYNIVDERRIEMGLFDTNTRDEFCRICRSVFKLGKDEPLPPSCPFCGTDLQNPDSEILRGSVECEHIQGKLGINDGELFVTNLRFFWKKGTYDAEEFGGGRVANSNESFATGSITAAILNRGAGLLQVNVPWENYAGYEDMKKGLRKGINVLTKSGETYYFCRSNMGKPQPMKDLLDRMGQ